MGGRLGGEGAAATPRGCCRTIGPWRRGRTRGVSHARRRGLTGWLAGLLVVLSALLGGAPRAVADTQAVGLLSPDPANPVSLAAPGVVITPGQGVPDPYVIKVAGAYYMFASQELFFGPNVPLTTSKSLGHWVSKPIDAMPMLPAWADPGFTWSPDVRKLDGRYVMWFNADVAGTGFDGVKCIGVATSAKVAGPYVSWEPTPAVCQLDHLGSIDPRTFRGPDGRLWLLWKSDDNSDLNADTHSSIYIQQLSSDGLRLVGQPTALMSADLPWEGRIVEAPDMVYAGGHYWLFFSGNWFNQPAYGIGLALCNGPAGPCSPASTAPWLSSNAQGAGPGEESLYYDGSRWWILYAPFAVDFQAFTPRPVEMARVVFGAHGPVAIAPWTKAWFASDIRLDPPKAHDTCTADRSDASCDPWRARPIATK